MIAPVGFDVRSFLLSQASSDDFRLVPVDFPKPELLLFEIAMGEVKSAALQEGNGKGMKKEWKSKSDVCRRIKNVEVGEV